MLSDEEREFIEEIQKGNKIGIYELIRTFKREGIENFITVRRKYIDIMINLIEKQSKEIEELNRLKGFEMLDIFNMGKQSSRQRIEFDYVDKDKIKAKIEEINKKYKAIESNYTEEVIDGGNFELDDYVELQSIQYADDILQSLLEKE